MNATKLARTTGLVLLGVMFVSGVLYFLPPDTKHSHTPGPYDEMVKVPPRNLSPVAEAVEPVTDSVGWLVELAGMDVGHAHRPFPKFCGEYSAVQPNHNYYLYNTWTNADGNHYHRGTMDHLFGADYKFQFRCGSNGNHYRDFPQGWW